MNGLSICIPVYNFNCIKSVEALCDQIRLLNLDAEVRVVDDASNKDLTELLNFKHPNYNYEKLVYNLGRSRVRNYLAKRSKYNHILYLDGDSGIKDGFLDIYAKQILKTPNAVICGGRYHAEKPCKSQILRYRYGLQFEEVNAEQRKKHPYKSFMTNNFIAPKQILIDIPFNEKISLYGQEDTFFGYELNKNNIDIVHINNPITHLDIDTNLTFIEKTKNSIKNLIRLQNLHPEFIEYSKLLNFIENNKILKSLFTKNLSNKLAGFFEKAAVKYGNVYSFQLFKLFYTISLNQNHGK